VCDCELACRTGQRPCLLTQFMAPEMHESATVPSSAQSDLYQIGMLMRDPLLNLSTDLSPQANQFIARLTQTNPAERPATVIAALNLLS
jgi:hypothetical protein